MLIITQIYFFFKYSLLILLNQSGSFFTGLPKYFFPQSQVCVVTLIGWFWMFSRGQNFPRYKHLGVKLICHENVYFKCAIYSVTVSSDKIPYIIIISMLLFSMKL